MAIFSRQEALDYHRRGRAVKIEIVAKMKIAAAGALAELAHEAVPDEVVRAGMKKPVQAVEPGADASQIVTMTAIAVVD